MISITILAGARSPSPPAARWRPRLPRAVLRWPCAPACLLVLFAGIAPRAAGQILRDAPVTLAGGRLVLGAQAAVSVASGDPGYFDYSSYDQNLMRLVRLDGAASFRVADRLFLIGDLRLEGSSSGGPWRLRPYAAFVRLRPWPRRAFDLQAGIIPPVFGSFARRSYPYDNPLIGFPLVYQYLTSLRPDAVPASADDLLAMRGRGWLPRYTIGSREYGSGLPVIDGLRDHLGIEVHAGGGRRLEASASLTAGSLSQPAGEYARRFRQISGRAVVRPVAGLALGISGSHGPFLARSLADLDASASGAQTAVGFDAEFSRERWLVRTEGVVSRWSLPRISAPFIEEPLGAFGLSVEGRYRVRPGLYAAARFDHLGFGSIAGTADARSWEAPVRRLELGAGYSLQRNMLLKAAWQQNWRARPPGADQGVFAAQVAVWF